MAVYIRVRRKGIGSQKVTVEAGDEFIGDDPDTVYWIRKQDSGRNDRGDLFTFDPVKPLVPEPGAPFHVIANTADLVTVQYTGAHGEPQKWDIKINVVDGKKINGEWEITSDGSATIKNH